MEMGHPAVVWDHLQKLDGVEPSQLPELPPRRLVLCWRPEQQQRTLQLTPQGGLAVEVKLLLDALCH
jgi:hypothetical protein